MCHRALKPNGKRLASTTVRKQSTGGNVRLGSPCSAFIRVGDSSCATMLQLTLVNETFVRAQFCLTHTQELQLCHVKMAPSTEQKILRLYKVLL